jgi:NTP pyrophosphatase (non-canonical NTP hydrolase)
MTEDQKITLRKVWDQQILYNLQVREIKPRNDADWMINYILGTISELSELLDEMNWKRHRLTFVKEFGPNVEEELADITKYVLSMWQLMNFSPGEMLEALYRKGEILDQLFIQETRGPLHDEDIVIIDLDGVLADFRVGFREWLKDSSWSELLSMGEHEFGLHMDINSGWKYSTYEEAKLEFEKTGGYKNLPPMQNVLKAVRMMSVGGCYIYAWTARPNGVYKRIWADTWMWLKDQNLPVQGLYFGNDERVVEASNLRNNSRVIAFEDNPVLARRYAASNIPVILIPQPYNKDLPHDHLIFPVKEGDSPGDIVMLAEKAIHQVYHQV